MARATKYLLFLGTICFYHFTLQAQSKNLDSLWSVYNNKSQADTNRLKAIHSIAWECHNNNPDTAIILAEQELKLAASLRSKVFTEIAKTYEAKALHTIAAAFQNKSNYPKALEYDLKALKIFEETCNKKGMGACYGNIGTVYWYQVDYPKALEYYFKGLKILEVTGNKKGIGACYQNIGNVYNSQTNYPKALEYQLKALKIQEEIGDKQGIGGCYINIANVYNVQGDYSKALDYYLKGLKILEEIGDIQSMGYCYGNMSALYNKLANYKLAILYSDSQLVLCKKTGNINEESSAYESLANAYSKTGRYKEAYENHFKFKQLTDSIFNTENSKQLGDMKTKFEVEKKEAELKIKSDAEQDKLKAVSKEEEKRQRVIIISVVGVLSLVVVFSLFLYRRFKITQKQKQVIEEQKVLVDKAYENLHEKNKEVIDSINYASRIQRALLTSEKYIANSLSRLIRS